MGRKAGTPLHYNRTGSKLRAGPNKRHMGVHYTTVLYNVDPPFQAKKSHPPSSLGPTQMKRTSLGSKTTALISYWRHGYYWLAVIGYWRHGFGFIYRPTFAFGVYDRGSFNMFSCSRGWSLATGAIPQFSLFTLGTQPVSMIFSFGRSMMEEGS